MDTERQVNDKASTVIHKVLGNSLKTVGHPHSTITESLNLRLTTPPRCDPTTYLSNHSSYRGQDLRKVVKRRMPSTITFHM